MPSEIAVTGASGQIGGLVAKLLDQAGLPARLLLRPGRNLEGLKLASRREFQGFHDVPAARSALSGVEVLFMVSAAEAPDRLAQHFSFLDAAAAAGVQHIVYTSFIGASPTSTFTLARDHWATEQRIIAKGFDHTFLRDNFYLDLLPHFADQHGVIRGPAADGRVAAVARADVSRSAAAILLDPAKHLNTSYDLTGPEALSLPEVAAEITRLTGRATSFQHETVAEAYASRAVFNAPDWELDAWVSTYTAIAAGEMAALSPAVRELTGREPLSLGELLSIESGKV
ncbi:SDR family oxidoreductase [Psychromicrobium lacuslunae]|uniref:Nucleoside-diphosphate sugar epimerase n=1 Tax=Psychromicrobium lacuslunae TaxID=1618207 RepID=A0A0D4C366_9MICC|nr:SDR family oxidoreductase [Psychromicrobium lacuslunae]AJT43102.1 nucleoside-diphosphate sugar epimerase [Psychromicrobium lacuslunae]